MSWAFGCRIKRRMTADTLLFCCKNYKALHARRMSPSVLPHLHFASPRRLPKASRVKGRVVVLDIAFAATAGGGVSFATVTKPFIDGLGDRLVAWVDHHEHEKHVDYKNDSRFVLSKKSIHGGCPEMISESIVDTTGVVDTIVCHLDLDGLYSAAKWICYGKEPYPGADDDARAIDTRKGTPSATAILVDNALRARFRDTPLKHSIVAWLVGGCKNDMHRKAVGFAADEFALRRAGAEALAKNFVREKNLVWVSVDDFTGEYDKTELLLLGQNIAPVAIVRESGMVTVAADFDSEWDFVQMLDLEGGMPTRVTVPDSRFEELRKKVTEYAIVSS